MSEPLRGEQAGQVTRAPQWLMPVGLVVTLVLAAGWFVLSWIVMKSSPVDAFGEAVGVALGLLIVLSVIGAVLNRPRGD